MKAATQSEQVLATLTKIKGFNTAFPHLIKTLKKGEVYTWDSHGYTGLLNPDQIENIGKLEEYLKEYNGVVYAVCESEDPVHMDAYLFVTDDTIAEESIMKANSDSFYALANVINKSWGIEEMGSVVIKRVMSGGPQRVG